MKKKVYVETTAVSDATVLPLHDIVQLERICTLQMLQDGGH